MFSADRDALLCDLAETYGIFDYRVLPVATLAVLAAGLREDSRIKMRLSGERAPRKDLLLAAAVDRLSFLAWAMTEDGQNGVNRPASVVDAILGEEKPQGDVKTFDSAGDFEAEWIRITGVGHG